MHICQSAQGHGNAARRLGEQAKILPILPQPREYPLRDALAEGRVQEVSEITVGLKALAKELAVPIMALSQLSRRTEQRGSEKEPQLSDLRESGAIEQDADVVIFLSRPEYYDKDTPDKNVCEVIVAKQRNGPTGKIVLAFLDKFTKFANMEFRERE